jgi:hypothetical protein
MITTAFAVFVLSVAEVAVIVAVPPVGVAAGAVYVVVAPLAVDATLNVPHTPVGTQLQFTEGSAGSFIVDAAITEVVPVCIAPGGGVVKEIDIVSGLIVIVWLAVLLLSVTELAVIVTLPPAGTETGAV